MTRMRKIVLALESLGRAGIIPTASTQLGAGCGLAVAGAFCRRSSQALLGGGWLMAAGWAAGARPSVSASCPLSDDAATAMTRNAIHRLSIVNRNLQYVTVDGIASYVSFRT